MCGHAPETAGAAWWRKALGGLVFSGLIVSLITDPRGRR